MRSGGIRFLFAVLLAGWISEGQMTAEAGPGRPPEEEALFNKWCRVARRPPPNRTDPIRLPAYGWIGIFQRFLSPVDGASCSYHPTCSAYGMRAIEAHGLLLGVPMTAERVMRNHRPENRARYPLIEKGGDVYYSDPVRQKGKRQR